MGVRARTAAVAGAACLLLGSAGVAPAAARPPDVAPAVAAATPKPRCSSTALQTKVLKRTLCLPARRVRSRDDLSLNSVLLTTAFGGTLDAIRAKRGPLGPRKALRRIGPRAQKRLALVLPSIADSLAVAALRTRAPGATIARRTAPRARAAAGPAAGVKVNGTNATFSVPEYGVQGTMTGQATPGGGMTGSAKVEMTGKTANDIFGQDVTINGRATVVPAPGAPFGYDLKELTLSMELKGIRFTVTLSLKIRPKGDSCPTSEGVAEEQVSVEAILKFRIATAKGSINLASGEVAVVFDGASRGQTADDAKLDTVETKLSGGIGAEVTTPLGSAGEKFEVQREASVNMRTGAVTASGNSRLTSKTSGVIRLLAGLDDADVKKALRDYVESSQKLVESALDGVRDRYREREQAWLNPETCLNLTWTPASGKQRVRLGDAGTISGAVKAKRDGKKPLGKWTRTAQDRGTFEPDSTTTAAGADAPVNWKVTGTAGNLSGTYQVTSKAGVAQAPWTAEIQPDKRYYKILSAYFEESYAGELYSPPAPGTYKGTGTANLTLLQQPFDVEDNLLPGGSGGERVGRIRTTGTAKTVMDYIGYDTLTMGACGLHDEFDFPGGAFIGFDIKIGGGGATTAELNWDIRGPGVGVINFMPGSCIWQPIGTAAPAGIGKQTVDAAIFEATAPQTLRHEIDLKDIPITLPPPGGKISLKGTYVMTIQQVKEDGSPL